MEWMKKKKHMLVYCGNPGIGKTYLCACLVDWAMTNFPSFRYYSESDLLSKLKKGFENNWEERKELELALDDPFIMLDDIGSNNVNDWKREVIFNTIDIRYNSMLPTVVTSNFSKDEFEKIYHKRLSSRLFSSENTIIEIHDGVDFRNEV